MNAPLIELDVTTRGLAREQDVTVGTIRLQPSLCRAEIDGEPRHLEPRVTRVLLALSKAAGAVLSRDDLITLCWDGRIVGDDAINRVIGKIRRLAEGSQSSFQIETVPRVGYRLIQSDPSLPDADAARPPEAKEWPATSPMVSVVAVLPFDSEGGPEACSLAEGATDCILSNLARDAGVAVVGKPYSSHFCGARKGDAARALGANRLVDGAVSVHGDVVRITIFLIEGISGLTLWSEQFNGTVADPFTLQQAGAMKVREALCPGGQTPGRQ